MPTTAKQKQQPVFQQQEEDHTAYSLCYDVITQLLRSVDADIASSSLNYLVRPYAVIRSSLESQKAACLTFQKHDP